MNELWEYLHYIVSTCNDAITFSGNITNVLNRWLIKTQEVEKYEANNIKPFLSPTGRILQKHELEFLPKEELEHNWRWYVPNDWNRFLCEYNSIQRDVELNSDKYIYAVAAVYCANDQEAMMYCNSMTPFSMWINGQLVHTSNYDFFVRENHFVYNFKKGVNILLIEKPYFLRHEDLKILHDEFLITLKPYEYCADPKENHYFDIELFNKLRDMYTIILNKSVYGDEDEVEALVMPRYFESKHMDEDITISAYDDRGELLVSVDTKTITNVKLAINATYHGVIKVIATCKNKESEILDTFIVKGDLQAIAAETCNIARARLDCNETVISDFEQLVSIPNDTIGVMNCSDEMMPSTLYHIIFEKLYELCQYIRKPDSKLVKLPSEMYNYCIPVFYKTEIDDNDLLYYVLLPKNYDRTKRYPMFLYIEHGIGISRFPTLKDYHFSQDYDNTIIVQTCGRGILNRDYIHEASVVNIIDTVVKNYNIDRDRIYLIGTCNGAKKGYGLAIKNPGLFAAIFNINGTIRTDLVNPDYELIHNLDTISINQLFNVEEEAFNGARVAEAFSHIKNIKIWSSSYYSHDDFNDAQNSNILIKELLKCDRNKYPKHIHFTTYDAMFNRCNWIQVDQMLDLTSKCSIDAKIVSTDHIVLESNNIGIVSLLLNKEEMNLDNVVTITIDGQDIQIKLTDYLRVIIKWNQEGFNVEMRNLTKEEYFKRFDVIKIDDSLMGLKQLYFKKCRIVSAPFYRGKKDIMIRRLLKLLNSPLREKNKNYRYDKFVEDELDTITIADSNFVYLASINEPSKLQQRLLEQANCEVTKEQITYDGTIFTGESFVLAKCANPYNIDRKALLVAYNSDAMLQEIINLFNTFDTNGIFYADAIVYNDGQYHTVQNQIME